MNGNAVLFLAVGLVAGLMIGQGLKQCPSALPVAPKASTNHWDVLVTGIPIVGKLFD